jgi:hypothetical protein
MATVDIGTPLLDKIKDFRMSKHSQGNSAIVVKIDKSKLEMDIEDEFNNITLEDLKEGKMCTSFWGYIHNSNI